MITYITLVLKWESIHFISIKPHPQKYTLLYSRCPRTNIHMRNAGDNKSTGGKCRYKYQKCVCVYVYIYIYIYIYIAGKYSHHLQKCISFFSLNRLPWIISVLVTLSKCTLCDPMNCNPPGSSVCRILQARILEWVALSFVKGSS